jgi:hypothetical protein
MVFKGGVYKAYKENKRRMAGSSILGGLTS